MDTSWKDFPDDQRIPRAEDQPKVEPKRNDLGGRSKESELATMELIGSGSRKRGTPPPNAVKPVSGPPPEDPQKQGEVEDVTGIVDQEVDPFNAAPADKPLSELLNAERPKPVKRPKVAAPAAVESESTLDKFFKTRTTIGVKTADGEFTVPIIGMCADDLCIALLVPLDEFKFIPATGGRFTLKYEGLDYKCYFPGTYAEFAAAGFGILSLLKCGDEEE